MKLYPLIFLVAVGVTGCASINSLPQSASDVEFEIGDDGKTGWAEWQDTMYIKKVDKRTAYMAAKSGLSDAGFTIKRANYEQGFAIGEHGMTAYDWNVVAGVYIKPDDDGTAFKVIIEGSKDVGFWGDMTDASWDQRIFKGIRQYILTESMITDPDRDIFN